MVRVLDAVVLIPGACLEWDVESSVTPTSHREPRSCESVTTILVLGLCMFSQSSAGLNTSFAGGDLRLPELPEYFDSRSGSGLCCCWNVFAFLRSYNRTVAGGVDVKA